MGVVAVTRFVLVTFFFLAVAFYELSGGAGFVPEQRLADAAAPVETVTRADTVTLASLTEIEEAPVANTLAVPLIEPAQEVIEVAEPVADPVVDAVVAQVAAAPVLDLRRVSAELVNVREGPGTDYAVMDKLVQGTETEVLEVEASGWAHVRVIDSGLLGWVSAEYLAAENG